MPSSVKLDHSPPSAGAAARDWAALPSDVLSTVFLKLGPCREIMRGTELACAAWLRAALEDPGLWRRVDIDVGALLSAGLRKGWSAMLRAAVDRGGGSCEAFSGPCDQELLLYLVERVNSLKSLHLLCLDVPNEVLNVAVKKYPLLEDLELTYVGTPSDNMLKYVRQKCPQLQKLKMHFNVSFGDDYHAGVLMEIIEGEIPVMCELWSLKLLECDLTTEGLRAILDSCPHLEFLHVTGSFRYYYEVDEELQVKCSRVKNLSIPKNSIYF